MDERGQKGLSLAPNLCKHGLPSGVDPSLPGLLLLRLRTTSHLGRTVTTSNCSKDTHHAQELRPCGVSGARLLLQAWKIAGKDHARRSCHHGVFAPRVLLFFLLQARSLSCEAGETQRRQKHILSDLAVNYLAPAPLSSLPQPLATSSAGTYGAGLSPAACQPGAPLLWTSPATLLLPALHFALPHACPCVTPGLGERANESVIGSVKDSDLGIRDYPSQRDPMVSRPLTKP